MAVLSIMRKPMLAAALACTLTVILLYYYLPWVHLSPLAPVAVCAHPTGLQPHNASSVATAARLLTGDQKELLCELKSRARLRTVDGSEEPFSSLGWSRLVPSVPLERLIIGPRGVREVGGRRPTASPLHYTPGGNRSGGDRGGGDRGSNSGFGSSCAVVSSAGAMLSSGLGEEIDSHQEVMRFNHAPTAGYEKDVGARTTFRLINEQIQYRPEFRFGDSPLYRHVALVTWEKGPRGDRLDLSEWYARGKMFGPYVKRREADPCQPFYVLHPGYVRQLWQAIQRNTREAIQSNEPTSGFLGILVMMALCDEVHVYEYIPSARQTSLCHYFERGHDMDCTLGGPSHWHPLEFEKRLIRRLNTGSEVDLKRGRVTLPGYSAVNCD